jgi:hypothetical protein
MQHDRLRRHQADAPLPQPHPTRGQRTRWPRRTSACVAGVGWVTRTWRGSATARQDTQKASDGWLAGMGIRRQLAALDDLLRRAERVPEVEAVILIGSLASGAADPVSDVDAIVIVGERSFDAAYQQRHAFHADSVPACWDHPFDPSSAVAAHKWIDDGGVLVEVLIATASGPLRVAEPARVVLGDPAVLTRTNRRPPIRREEMTESAHPVESAYDKLKEAVRHASLQPPTA